jgi:2-haloacid dehalogenase
LHLNHRPDPANFRFALAQLGSAYPSFDPADVIVVAQSLLHDHVPAHALGLSSAWIARPDALTCMSGAGVPADEAARDAFATFKFGGMREFAEAMQQARK